MLFEKNQNSHRCHKKKLDPIPTPLKSKVDSRIALNPSAKLNSKTKQPSKSSSSKATTTDKTSIKTTIKTAVSNKPVTSKPKPVVKPKSVAKEKVATKSLTDKEKSKQLKSKKPIKSFAIQVGTFDSNENAEKVRDKLRKAGYTAYIQKSKSKTNPSYRVRIGPELDYDVLEKLLIKLKKSKKMDGYIVNHP